MRLSKIIDKLFIKLDKESYTENDTVVVVKHYKFYFVIKGENNIFKFLRDDSTEVKVVKLNLRDVITDDIEKYVELERIAHAKTDNKEQKQWNND